MKTEKVQYRPVEFGCRRKGNTDDSTQKTKTCMTVCKRNLELAKNYKTKPIETR